MANARGWIAGLCLMALVGLCGPSGAVHAEPRARSGLSSALSADPRLLQVVSLTAGS